MPQSSVDLWIRNSNQQQYGYGSHHEEHSRDYYSGFTGSHYPSSAYAETDPALMTSLDGLSPRLSNDQETCSNSIPDTLLLAHYCSLAHSPNGDTDEAILEADVSWDPVRDWMRKHSATDVQMAVEQRDASGKTALHFACQNAPPDDVMDVFFSIAGDVVQWPDSFGWLPIHYACAYAASPYVIKGLAKMYPASKTTVDHKGRTPLHFALGTSHAHSADIIVILSSTGAASYADDNGMLVSE